MRHTVLKKQGLSEKVYSLAGILIHERLDIRSPIRPIPVLKGQVLIPSGVRISLTNVFLQGLVALRGVPVTDSLGPEGIFIIIFDEIIQQTVHLPCRPLVENSVLSSLEAGFVCQDKVEEPGTTV